METKKNIKRSLIFQVGNRGSILILALWTITLLGIFAMACGTIARQEILIARNLENRTGLYALASSGTIRTIESIKEYYVEKKGSKVDSMASYWANNETLCKDIKFGEGGYSIESEQLNPFSGSRELIYGLIDEERKLNVSKASVEILTKLIVLVAEKDEITAKKIASDIVDWRDKDDRKWSQAGGFSEHSYYKHAKLGYYPRNLPFKTVEEVLLVNGMDQEVFQKVRNYITVYGNGRININTVSYPVLRALGLNETLATKILSFRYGADLKLATADDKVFSSVDSIVKGLEKYCGLEQTEKEELTELIFTNILDVTSLTLRTYCISNINNSDMHAEVVCVFDKNGTIKYWGSKYSN
jgi:type II secretory pathway component PulK